MTTTPPKISPLLREKTLQLWNDPSPIVERALAALMASDSTYAALTPAVRLDVMEHIQQSATLWFESFLQGAFPDQEKLESIMQFGRRRVHQGIALTSLLHAFRLSTRQVWDLYLDIGREHESLRDELLFSISPYLLDHFDAMAQAFSQAYLDEQYQRTRWRDALRYELCNIVFNSPADSEQFAKVAQALGLEPNGLRVAVAFDLRLADIAPTALEGELDRFIVAVARHVKTGADDLVRIMQRGRLIVWVPCARGDSIVATDERLRKQVPTLAAVVARVEHIGVGLMNFGAQGWATSAAEAIRALDNGMRSGDGASHFYSAIAVDESVLRSDNALRYLDSLLERLSHEPELLRTLETYFAQRQRRKSTAAALGIHPNTLTFRLDRVEALLGAKLNDVGWMMRIDIAMKLRKATSLRE